VIAALNVLKNLHKQMGVLLLQLDAELKSDEPADQPLKDQAGRLTEAGKKAILDFYAVGGGRNAAVEEYEISYTTAHNYWAEHLRRQK